MRWTWHVSCLEFLGRFVGGVPGQVVLVGHRARSTQQPDPHPSVAEGDAGEAWVRQLPGVRKDHLCPQVTSPASCTLFQGC